MSNTTQLEAVNTLLSSIGESPVNSINSGLNEASTALQILEQTSRQTQVRGWYFNTEVMTIPSNTLGEVSLPKDTLKFDAGTQQFVMRGAKVYDKFNNTYKINSPVRAELVLKLAFEELPEIARNYITVRAARIFQDRVVGSASLHGFQKQDELDALTMLHEAELQTGNHSIFDNAGLQHMLTRRASSSRSDYLDLTNDVTGV